MRAAKRGNRDKLLKQKAKAEQENVVRGKGKGTGKPSPAEATMRLELSKEAKEPAQLPKVNPSRVAIARL